METSIKMGNSMMEKSEKAADILKKRREEFQKKVKSSIFSFFVNIFIDRKMKPLLKIPIPKIN